MTTPNESRYQYIQFTGRESYRRYIQKDIPEQAALRRFEENSSPNVKSHGSYGALLLHPNWKAKRREILHRDMSRCVHCGNNQNLQVHHRQYHFIENQQKFRLPWDYKEHLLITLCESCHSRGHNKYKVPTITI